MIYTVIPSEAVGPEGKRTEVYYPDGRVLVRVWAAGTRPAYPWLSKTVDGYIEGVDRFLPGAGQEGCRVQAYANEEGRLNNLPVNIPGMKALHWPEPPQGWDGLRVLVDDEGRYTVEPGGPIFMHSGMSEAALAAAHKAATQRWDPVVGTILIMRGWSEEEYDDDEGEDPADLGKTHTLTPGGKLVPA